MPYNKEKIEALANQIADHLRETLGEIDIKVKEDVRPWIRYVGAVRGWYPSLSIQVTVLGNRDGSVYWGANFYFPYDPTSSVNTGEVNGTGVEEFAEALAKWREESKEKYREAVGQILERGLAVL